MKYRVFLLLLWVIATATMTGCAKQPPSNINDACTIFEEKKSWYAAVDEAEQRWRIPKHVILAFIHQESSFKSHAKPPNQKLLGFIPVPGFIPWFRPSSAYGYSQALDTVWEEYKEQTGRWYARRSSFSDAADFIGWYNHHSVRTLKLSPQDASDLYLAYHEGRNGYKQKTYRNKAWLIKVADKVKRNAKRYEKQIKACQPQPEVKWYDFIPFI